jgi:hypothetical protein
VEAAAREIAAYEIIKQIKASPAIPIHADNSQGSMLYIEEASVKEISEDDFAVLMGEASKHFNRQPFQKSLC